MRILLCTLGIASVFLFMRCGGCGEPIDGELVDSGDTGDGSADGPNMSCANVAQTCATGADCCSGICDPGTLTCAMSCGVFGQSCTNNSTCCSGVCDSAKSTCTQPKSCSPTGSSCTVGTDCCGLACIGGLCGAACVSDGQACTSNGACCSGTCTSNVCASLNPGGCKTGGNSCGVNSDCCSGLCSAGKTCSTASSFCSQTNDVCAKSTDCCSQNCVIASGKTLGTCQANATSGSGGCTVAGTLCSGCGSCCSALCLSYAGGPTSVCQVASGCHVTGDLCTKTSDCCGAPGTGLPGAGQVYCNIPAGAKVGTCHKPTGCNPEGAVCHYTGPILACGNSRNDCCGAPGSAGSGVCKLDTEGIPRCYGLTSCVMAGGFCADSADCCNSAACVPDASGALKCGASSCSPTGGACTVAGDCCVAGNTCVVAAGSVQGVCTAPTPPPPVDGGATDGGTPSDMGLCALYGQGCSVGGTPCCNGVPCSQAGGLGTSCRAGDTGCSCYSPIP